MRRFWHGKLEDFDDDEILAFFDTLPENSATLLKHSDAITSTTNMLLAQIVDSIRALGVGLGGHKMRKDQMMAAKLTKEAAEKTVHADEARKNVIKQLKENRGNLKGLMELMDQNPRKANTKPAKPKEDTKKKWNKHGFSIE